MFGLLPGFGFMFSPAVSALGVGFLRLQFSEGFSLTRSQLRTPAFALALGGLAETGLGLSITPFWVVVRECPPKHLSGYHARPPPMRCNRSDSGESLLLGLSALMPCMEEKELSEGSSEPLLIQKILAGTAE